MHREPSAAILIRPEQPDDRRAIYAVHAASFPTHVEADLVDALRDGAHLTISLVALVDEHLVGHVAFSPVTAAGPAVGLGLAPVAVLPGYRNRGIAAALIHAGIAASRDRAVDFVVVLGEPRYYSRFGFVPASQWALRDEYGGGDAFQIVELRRGSIPRGGHVVRYCSEFSWFVPGGETR